MPAVDWREGITRPLRCQPLFELALPRITKLDVAAVKEHCCRYPGASSKLYGPPSNVLVYYARGRKFAYFKTSEPEQWRFSLRTTPEYFLALTDVPGIKPARYMAKFHWITIVDVSAVPADYLLELIDWSYAKAMARPGKTSRRDR